MTPEEQYVRNASKKGVLFFSEHAYEKMVKLKINKSAVIDCIENGKLVEYQNGYTGESPRMLFYYGHSNPFYVVIAIEVPNSVVITVCERDLSIWEVVGETIKRK